MGSSSAAILLARATERRRSGVRLVHGVHVTVGGGHPLGEETSEGGLVARRVGLAAAPEAAEESGEIAAGLHLLQGVPLLVEKQPASGPLTPGPGGERRRRRQRTAGAEEGER